MAGGVPCSLVPGAAPVLDVACVRLGPWLLMVFVGRRAQGARAGRLAALGLAFADHDASALVLLLLLLLLLALAACRVPWCPTAGWKGRRAAVLGLVAFATFAFNYYGVNILIIGLHSYGGLPTR